MTIVPEIDMPGHTNAALASYAELNCDGQAPPLYSGIDVGFSTLCVNKDVTYKFITDIVREIGALTAGPYFHVGGDEVQKLTPQQFIAFIERVQAIVEGAGQADGRMGRHRTGTSSSVNDCSALAARSRARGGGQGCEVHRLAGVEELPRHEVRQSDGARTELGRRD